jgi:hypothetical protein
MLEPGLATASPGFSIVLPVGAIHESPTFASRFGGGGTPLGVTERAFPLLLSATGGASLRGGGSKPPPYFPLPFIFFVYTSPIFEYNMGRI